MFNIALYEPKIPQNTLLLSLSSEEHSDDVKPAMFYHIKIGGAEPLNQSAAELTFYFTNSVRKQGDDLPLWTMSGLFREYYSNTLIYLRNYQALLTTEQWKTLALTNDLSELHTVYDAIMELPETIAELFIVEVEELSLSIHDDVGELSGSLHLLYPTPGLIPTSYAAP